MERDEPIQVIVNVFFLAQIQVIAIDPSKFGIKNTFFFQKQHVLWSHKKSV